MSKIKIIECTDRTIACDGGVNFGHPMVYLDVPNPEGVKCPYCSQHYKIKIKSKT